jgi:hypothetical protein
MMQTHSDYERAAAIVRAIIHQWDPYHLLEGGAPLDEWDNEIAQIVIQISQITSASDAATVISRVFSAAFQPEGFTPEDCTEVGQQLFSALKTGDIITPRSA